MPKKLEHIGIAVANLEKSEKLFKNLLGVDSYKREEVESEGVMTSFFLLGDVKIELLAATKPDSPIAKFIEKKGEGIHHLAFESDDIVNELKDKENNGFNLIHNTPKDGADNKSIAFLHPKSTNSVLIELCQEKS
jgi:methylmalonyl-CoA/ethylmalonyl-CoA epimerase